MGVWPLRFYPVLCHPISDLQYRRGGVGMLLLRIFRFSDLWLPTSEPEGFLVGVWILRSINFAAKNRYAFN